MSDGGFIKIHRKLSKSFFYKDSEYVCLWIHCLLRANWEDKKVLWNGVVIDLKRGQFICGRKSISKELHINEYKVRRILDVFESAHQIKQHKTNKYTIITIINYDKYQGDAQQDAHQTHIKPPTNRQQTHTDKEYKELKKLNNIRLDLQSWKWENITEGHIADWKKAYPLVDINISLNQMIVWCKAHQSDGKGKKKNWEKFISGWLARGQEKLAEKGAPLETLEQRAVRETSELKERRRLEAEAQEKRNV